jgi:hypothetical protein
MRLPIAATRPLPDQLSGMPVIPNRKTTRIPTITTIFQPKFLFMMISLIDFDASGPFAAYGLSPDFPASSAVVTAETDARLTSIFKLSGGTRKWM